nr:fasciclin domain-containing protein [Synergistales bacterium]
LIRILRAHLLEGMLSEADLREKASVTNLNGDTLKLEQDWFSTSIGGASIRSYEINTTNGVIHMVDKVILPGK